ncbi:hypothetical protein HG1285_13222 [Hydrogenivirga sp. 128-5-R1-1]|nr:hypothetical protein HG1285_13222 [Hydrogenivirga sp. 128-5-R1-1]
MADHMPDPVNALVFGKEYWQVVVAGNMANLKLFFFVFKKFPRTSPTQLIIPPSKLFWGNLPSL